MERRHQIAGAAVVAVRIRVRGMSKDARYFDEDTETARLAGDFIVIRLRTPVDLDSELHIMNVQTQVGGNYRVVWTHSPSGRDSHSVGLEMLDAEGDIWVPDSAAPTSTAGVPPPTAALECLRCHRKISTSVPEAEAEYISEGFSIALACEYCKATTAWAFGAGDATDSAPAAASAPAPVTGAYGPASVSTPKKRDYTKDERTKGRAPLKMLVKIIRSRFGKSFFDICETLNVSRTGFYFNTDQGYELGEHVEVVMPYHPETEGIHLRARVVRVEGIRDSLRKGVAIQLAGLKAVV
jgi:hypothetical protein